MVRSWKNFFGDFLGFEEYITVLQNEQGNTIIKVGGVTIKMIENFNNIRRIIAKHHDYKIFL